MKNTFFFHDKPLFGLDIHSDSFRIMQIGLSKNKPTITSYGYQRFDQPVLKDGIIDNPAQVASIIKAYMASGLNGKLTSNRVALAIPATRTFNRSITLPNLPEKELKEAIQLEIEQYVPIPIDSLYISHSILSKTNDQVEAFTIAATKQVVDSYMQVAAHLNLEPVLVETRPDAMHRLFAASEQTDVPILLINIGRYCVDISIIQDQILASSSVSLSQESTGQAADENYAPLIKEVRSMIHYYQERHNNTSTIEQVAIFGKPASLMGLVTFMTEQLRLPVRSVYPLKDFAYSSGLPQIPQDEMSRFSTAAGLALAPPHEVLA